ncbi:HAD-like domain [Penicillium roqueforti FM164]|uniref:HAD-like domain n=1 Tax=Penicillium roqueforti (strain FM164) TaxID=1365484 RepID=W6QIR1_PENRF|nr:HAD-like domain [Penicillium roqueforti FM164]
MTTLKYPMSIQGIILSKFWFGFDLDDTLHEFRRASANASVRVFETIHASNNKTSVDTLKNTYQDILRNTTANAFTDGRTSSEYRRERFGRLLQTHGLTDDSFLSRLRVDCIFCKLCENWERKSLSLLQEWTVQELGIRPYIDVLVTTNEVGKSKIDGLFGAVLEKYGIAAEDIVYFGDNAIRDVQAARQEGILAVLYDEKQQSRFYDISALRVDSWAIVEKVLVHGDI